MIQLRDYQKEAINFFRDSGGRCLFALPPGAGKTFTALYIRKVYPKIRKTLIICPASLKLQWKKNFEYLFPEEDCAIINGIYDYDIFMSIRNKTCIIINYDILHRSSLHINWTKALSSIGFDLLILDESHKLKEEKSSRTQDTFEIAKTCRAIVELTGTPVYNNIVDLWAQLHILDPYSWRCLEDFKVRYLERNLKKIHLPGGKSKRVWDYGNPKNTEELKRRIEPRIFIKTDAEVFKELPEMSFIDVPVEVSFDDEYITLEKTFTSFSLSSKEDLDKAEECLARIRYWLGMSKVKAAIDFIEDMLTTREKIVVFAYHRNVVEAIYEKYKKSAVKYYGGMSEKEKDNAIKKFKEDKNIRLFIGNLGSASTGLDGLHEKTNTCVYVELPYLWSEVQQASGRVRRANSTYSNYFSYFLVADDSLDYRIKHLLYKKKKNAENILENKDTRKSDLFYIQNKER